MLYAKRLLASHHTFEIEPSYLKMRESKRLIRFSSRTSRMYPRKHIYVTHLAFQNSLKCDGRRGALSRKVKVLRRYFSPEDIALQVRRCGNSRTNSDAFFVRRKSTCAKKPARVIGDVRRDWTSFSTMWPSDVRPTSKTGLIVFEK